jgi:hypothetical protein
LLNQINNPWPFFTLLCVSILSPIQLQASEKYIIAVKFINERTKKETDCNIILDDKPKIMTVQSEFLKFRVKYPDIIAADVETRKSRNYFTNSYKVPKAEFLLIII